VELSALLHDIDWITDHKNDSDHEISGQPIAEKILKQFNYADNVIKEVKHVIASHRGSKNTKPKTLTAQIIANADAMSHFDAIPWYIKIGLDNFDGDINKSIKWIYEKAGRDWNKKLTLPEAKELVKDKYEAIKILLEPMLK
jgi:hypothetical protein